MSMKVDLSTPLTADERAYLNERGRTAEIDRADALHGVVDDTVYAGDGTGPRTQQLMTGLAAVERAEVLKREIEQLGYKVIIESLSEAEAEEGDGDELPPYESWKVADLDAELKDRGLPVTGDKAAKVKALYDNDGSQ